MTVETKYDLGDVIYLLKNNKIEKGFVTGMKIVVSYTNKVDKILGKKIEYEININGHYTMINDLYMFPTKEALLESL